MVDVSRRGFLAQLSIGTGVGIAGGLGLHKLLAGDSGPAMPVTEPTGKAQQPLLDAVSLAGPMLIHVRDVATAEVSMMVGTRELIYRDPELVARLVSTAQSAKTAKQEG
jgi:hypothetical protein